MNRARRFHHWATRPGTRLLCALAGRMAVTARGAGLAVRLVLLLASAGAVDAAAQSTGALMQGTIADQQGAVLPGATVTISNVETGLSRNLQADDRGWYRAPALPPGIYEIRAELDGFVTAVRTGLALTIGQEATIDLQLNVATLAETVTVTGAAPLVETSNSSLGTTVRRESLDNLPLAGR